ncbi:MAG TPA: c-type cytochrome [Burkholderiaceae bacterium]|nr:c-type cytochrome [Burkholderiaceae bacterium]
MSSGPADPHASFIKTPKQLIILVALAFVVPVLVIWLLAHFVAGDGAKAGAQAQSPEAVQQRLAKVGSVVQQAPTGSAGLGSGSEVYASSCAACHDPGVLGAPKPGDAAAWKPRIAQGFDTLVKHATEGFKAMPPKGGNAALDPQEVARAVAFMANESGAQFKAP